MTPDRIRVRTSSEASVVSSRGCTPVHVYQNYKIPDIPLTLCKACHIIHIFFFAIFDIYFFAHEPYP